MNKLTEVVLIFDLPFIHHDDFTLNVLTTGDPLSLFIQLMNASTAVLGSNPKVMATQNILPYILLLPHIHSITLQFQHKPTVAMLTKNAMALKKKQFKKPST